MDVSIIIVTYNTLALTRDCIESIFQHTQDLEFEVILVDNASTDGSREFFSRDKRIIYIYNSENVGFGRANNLGYKYASGKYIFLLNSDTYLLNNAIKQFKDRMDKQPVNTACIGTLLEDKSGEIMNSFGTFLSFKLALSMSKRIILPTHIPQMGVIVPVVIGADLFIRRTAIEQVGFFDPRFFMYHEENDLQRRFANAGFVSKIIEGPRIVHLEGKSSSSKLNALAVDGAYKYMKKWEPAYIYYIFRLLYAITRTPKTFIVKSSFNDKIKYLSALYKL